MNPILKYFRLTISVFLMLFFIYTNAQTLTADQWQEDLDFLYHTIKDVHPNPFHRAAESVFLEHKMALEKELNKLNDEQIIFRLMQIGALLHDGHSGVVPMSKLISMNNWYPISLDYFVDGIFVTGVGERIYEELLGAKVLKIGALTAQEAWQIAASGSGGDNEFCIISRVPLLFAMPQMLKGMGLSTENALELTVQTKSGQTKTVAIKPVQDQAGIHKILSGQSVPGSVSLRFPDNKVEDRDIYFQHPGQAYWYQLNNETGLLYAQINQVQNAEGLSWLNDTEKKVSLREFGEALFTEIDAGKVNKLVIDLRDNGGGNNFLMRPIVIGLAARPEINQKGKLFVITGRNTYSAAMNFTSMLESYTRAIFVGEPAGGSLLHYGDATTFQLPNSGLMLRVSTYHWDIGVEPWDIRTLMEVDLPAPPRFSMLVKWQDGAMDAIRTYQPGDILSDKMLEKYRAEGIDAALNYYKSQEKLPGIWGSQLQQLLEFGQTFADSNTKPEDIGKVIDLVTKDYPQSPELWFTLGRFHASQNRWQEAASDYEKALELYPTNDVIQRLYEVAKRK